MPIGKLREFGEQQQKQDENKFEESFSNVGDVEAQVGDNSNQNLATITSEKDNVIGVPSFMSISTLRNNTNTSNSEATGIQQMDKPAFTFVEVDSEVKTFAKEWTPNVETQSFIGEKDLLLEYIKKLERRFKVTMPIKACGIDPIVFEHVDYLPNISGDNDTEQDLNTSKAFSIPNNKEAFLNSLNVKAVNEKPFTKEGVNEQAVENVPKAANDKLDNLPVYELIKVDGDLYLSCATECLDVDYLHSVIAEATTSVITSGKYYYKMVDLRKLALLENETEARLLKTLKLNNYEMSILICYMKQMKDVEVSYIIKDNSQYILFTKK